MAKEIKIKTTNEFIDTVDTIAQKSVQLTQLEATRDREIQDVQERHKGGIEPLKKEIKALTSTAKIYAEDHRTELFHDASAKRAKTGLCTYGLIVNPPAIKNRGKAFPDERCIDLLKQNRRLVRFVRTREEIDREALLAAYSDGEITAEDLADVGLKRDQDIRFDVKPLVDSGDKATA
ncbi:MAG: host-nuclease inhibitor Gam family protein [Puniceicoccales bacterium]|jgi:phage host-nuclease inhibitor protein Gam|nr:host-nuclease inhibitor Gam family protein [Puniceicoccales bacterium]